MTKDEIIQLISGEFESRNVDERLRRVEKFLFPVIPNKPKRKRTSRADNYYIRAIKTKRP